MAGTEIATNTDTMGADIDVLEAALKNARDQLDKMFTEINELDTMWDGPANSEFNAQFAIDYETGKALCDTIESIIESVRNARTEYIKCENEVSGIISSIKI